VARLLGGVCYSRHWTPCCGNHRKDAFRPTAPRFLISYATDDAHVPWPSWISFYRSACSSTRVSCYSSDAGRLCSNRERNSAALAHVSRPSGVWCCRRARRHCRVGCEVRQECALENNYSGGREFQSCNLG